MESITSSKQLFEWCSENLSKLHGKSFYKFEFLNESEGEIPKVAFKMVNQMAKILHLDRKV